MREKDSSETHTLRKPNTHNVGFMLVSKLSWWYGKLRCIINIIQRISTKILLVRDILFVEDIIDTGKLLRDTKRTL